LHSLRRLRTDCIDLYQLHRPDPATNIEETLCALTGLIRRGKVRAIGASQTPEADIVEAQWVAERRGLARCRGPWRGCSEGDWSRCGREF
jgi:aryl-alcohol dehydrogenase-like predicted oxidoreductase